MTNVIRLSRGTLAAVVIAGGLGAAGSGLAAQVIPENTPIQSIQVSGGTGSMTVGGTAFPRATAVLADGSSTTRVLGGGGGVLWHIGFAPSIPVLVCGTDASSFSTQNWQVDPGGAFHDVWSFGSPNTLQVDGSMTLPTGTAGASLSAALACVNAAASGSLSAFWTGARYDGTYTFNGASGEVAVVGLRWSSSDPGVATVNAATGQVNALAPGDVTITATWGSLCWQALPGAPQCEGSLSGSMSIHVDPAPGGGGGGGGPIVTAGPDQTLECSSHQGASATLAGEIFFEPTTPITYTWTGPFGSAFGKTPTVTVPPGANELTFTISNGVQSASDTTMVTVVDTQSPVISTVSTTPSAIWPPNGRMAPASLSIVATDACDATLDCRIVGVTGDDGATSADWEVTGTHTLTLRAARSGIGAGRTYTVTVECTDDSGNAVTRAVPIAVPHDRR